VLRAYFPRIVRERWPDRVATHSLAREIAATQLANDLVNRVGPGFLHRIEERHGVGTPVAARAFTAAAAVLSLDPLWAMVDDDVPLAVEQLALPELQRATEHAADRLLRRHPDPGELTTAVPRLTRLVAGLDPAGWLDRPGQEADRARVLQAELLAAGGSAQLAAGVAVLRCQADVLELVELAHAAVVPAGAVIDDHVRLGEELGLPQLRERLSDQPADSSWVLAAKSALRDELDEYRVALTGAVVRTAGGEVGRFLAHHERAAGRFAAVRDSAASEPDQSVAVLTVAVSELRRLVLATT